MCVCIIIYGHTYIHIYIYGGCNIWIYTLLALFQGSTVAPLQESIPRNTTFGKSSISRLQGCHFGGMHSQKPYCLNISILRLQGCPCWGICFQKSVFCLLLSVTNCHCGRGKTTSMCLQSFV